VITSRRGRPKDEQHLAQRREEILEVAAHTFARLGYPSTDLQVVADELGVGKGTLYRYFPTKHDLFCATVDWRMHGLLNYMAVSAARHTDPLEQLTEAVRSYLEFFDRYPDSVELLIQERAVFRDRKRPSYFTHKEANLDRWREFIHDLIKANRLRVMNVDDVLEGLNDLLYGTIFTDHFAGRKEPMVVAARRIVDILFFGILSERERNHYRLPKFSRRRIRK
jgi:AcrR family transcriptional regulator